MKLRSKILIGYALLLTPIMLVWGWSIFNLARLGDASEAILQENYRSILAAENMIDVIERQDSNTLLLLIGDEAGMAEFRRHEVEFLEWLGRAGDNITLENETETIEAIERGYLAYLESFSTLHGLLLTDEAAALPYYQETILPTFRQVRDSCISLREINQNAMLAASIEAQNVAGRAIWSTAVIGVISVVMGLSFSLFLANILSRPLGEMTRAAERIARGDYNINLSVKSKDELGILADELVSMSQELKSYHELNLSQILAEKQRSEAIIRSISDGIIVVNGDFEVIALNPAAAQILGTTFDEARDRHFLDIVGNRSLYEQAKTLIESGNGLSASAEARQSVLEIETKAGTQYYNTAVTRVETQDHYMLGAVLLLQDVTKLKELDRLKSDFVATASHELRTPLTGIAMSIGLLVENAGEKLSADERELLAAAQGDVQRLRALVNDLLDLSKIESGRMEMAFEMVKPSLLAERAASTMEQQAGQAKIDLTTTVSEDLPPVKADPNKITWVLTNLIANGLRYTNGGGSVGVSGRKIGRFVHLAVTDTGAGITLEHQSKIFDKFVQVTSDRSIGGSGLGLAICKEIVKAHGGTIWVESTPGEGSTFTFTLPLATEDREPAAMIMRSEHNG